MMAENARMEEILRKLDEQHKAYLETFRLVHEALSQNAQNVVVTPPSSGLAPASPSPRKKRRSSTLDTERPHIILNAGARPPPSLTINTGDTDYSDDDDELYVQEILPSYQFDYENLKDHLKKYRFNKEGRKLLEKVVDERGRLLNPELFPKSLSEESSHNSHYSVFDVGTDGAPLSRHQYVSTGSTIDSAIWQAIRDLNADQNSLRPTVGRITIIREPNPVIMGALHLTMNPHIDMDEVFQHLVSSEESAAHLTARAFSTDQRHQRSFIFSFDYYTVIGDECKPMAWQPTEKNEKKSRDHIPLSRCSSIVALSLSGSCIKKLKNTQRRAKTQEGAIYDPWAPWHVLNIQCYPDHKHSMDSHDSTKHYVNGPEAFMTTLLAEFKDAQKRFEEIYNRISKLVTPSSDFMFSGELRDKLLFEDEEFTYSRRYFWAFQTLGTMNNAIKAIINSYEDTFTPDFWEGKHHSLWPMLDHASSRNIYWKKRMYSLKKDFEKEIKGLMGLYEENDDRRKEIRTLRDQLFSGTSVLESRKSVELSAVTILQGHNIKLLTLVSIFFLPLTFVTSVFGMTNMPEKHEFKPFAIVLATVCIPFFVLIGSLNTTSGMEFWRGKYYRVLSYLKTIFVKKQPRPKEAPPNGEPRLRERSYSTSRAINIRKNQLRGGGIGGERSPKVNENLRTLNSRFELLPDGVRESRERVTTPNANSGEYCGNGKEARQSDVAVPSAEKRNEKVRQMRPQPELTLSWRESIFGRKKRKGILGNAV